MCKCGRDGYVAVGLRAVFVCDGCVTVCMTAVVL